MRQQVRQNFNQSEKKADKYGILPWHNQPGFWARLFGETVFSIEPENILIHRSKSNITINYTDMESIECNKKYIHIKTSDNQLYNIKVGNNASDIAELILKLASENNEYNSFMNVEKVLLELGFAYFQKAFVYRANSYNRAINILLKTSLDNNFSEVNFKPTNDKVKISYQYSGKQKYIMEISKAKYENLIIDIKKLSNIKDGKTNQVIESTIKFKNIDVKLQIIPTENGEETILYFNNIKEQK